MSSKDLPVLGGDKFFVGESASEGRIRSGGSTRFPMRPGSSGSRPMSSHSRRTPTPTKQILLQAVKRKEEKIEVEEKIDWDDLNSALSQEAERKLTLSPHSEDEDEEEEDDDADDEDVVFDEIKKVLRYPDKHPPHEYNWKNELRKHDYQSGDQNMSSKSNKQTKRKEVPKEQQKMETETKPERKEESSSSSSEDDSDDEEEGPKVPMQLTMEFLTCLMDKDYPNASKLCKMILIYDPANKQALEFQPLIEEKMQQEEYLKNQSDDSDSDSDDDDDDDDSDDSGDESDESDEDDDEQEGENEENNGNPSPADSDEDKGDSGIASANSD